MRTKVFVLLITFVTLAQGAIATTLPSLDEANHAETVADKTIEGKDKPFYCLPYALALGRALWERNGISSYALFFTVRYPQLKTQVRHVFVFYTTHLNGGVQHWYADELTPRPEQYFLLNDLPRIVASRFHLDSRTQEMMQVTQDRVVQLPIRRHDDELWVKNELAGFARLKAAGFPRQQQFAQMLDQHVFVTARMQRQ